MIEKENKEVKFKIEKDKDCQDKKKDQQEEEEEKEVEIADQLANFENELQDVKGMSVFEMEV